MYFIIIISSMVVISFTIFPLVLELIYTHFKEISTSKFEFRLLLVFIYRYTDTRSKAPPLGTALLEARDNMHQPSFRFYYERGFRLFDLSFNGDFARFACSPNTSFKNMIEIKTYQFLLLFIARMFVIRFTVFMVLEQINTHLKMNYEPQTFHYALYSSEN